MRRLLFIVGSKREGSFNRQLARMAEGMVGDWAEVAYLDPYQVPFMDQDIEYPAPEAVSEARRAVLDADLIWIFTPEYNFQIPGAVKNLFDWLSRPLSPDDPDRASAAMGKKAIITGVGGGKKTLSCRTALKDLLEVISVEVIDGAGRGFSLDRRAFTEGIWEPGEDVVSELREQAELARDSVRSSSEISPDDALSVRYDVVGGAGGHYGAALLSPSRP